MSWVPTAPIVEDAWENEVPLSNLRYVDAFSLTYAEFDSVIYGRTFVPWSQTDPIETNPWA